MTKDDVRVLHDQLAELHRLDMIDGCTREIVEGFMADLVDPLPEWEGEALINSWRAGAASSRDIADARDTRGCPSLKTRPVQLAKRNISSSPAATTPITPAAVTDKNSNSGAVIYFRLIMKPPSLESTSGHLWAERCASQSKRLPQIRNLARRDLNS
jgi:hypothetical protein